MSERLSKPVVVALLVLGGCTAIDDPPEASERRTTAEDAAVTRGRQIFRHDTFGDERKWTDELQLHEVLATVSPNTALALGLKIDEDAIPLEIVYARDFSSPATTLEILSHDGIVGIEAQLDASGTLTRVGITCALCHSDVDDFFGHGIGRRIDGRANRDLDLGFLIAQSPALGDAAKAVLTSWGPGYYDPRWNIDGVSSPVVIPPLFDVSTMPAATYTGDGSISYWNAYVAVTQMGAQGVFEDARLGISISRQPDLVTPKLADLRAFQLSLEVPGWPANAFDGRAARRGKKVFTGAGRCSSCHRGTAFTDGALHDASETGMDPVYAARSLTKRYRTSPLRGLWQHPPYFHDGRAPTLAAVVDHYDAHLQLGLSAGQKRDLVEYLKSL